MNSIKDYRFVEGVVRPTLIVKIWATETDKNNKVSSLGIPNLLRGIALIGFMFKEPTVKMAKQKKEPTVKFG